MKNFTMVTDPNDYETLLLELENYDLKGTTVFSIDPYPENPEEYAIIKWKSDNDEDFFTVFNVLSEIVNKQGSEIHKKLKLKELQAEWRQYDEEYNYLCSQLTNPCLDSLKASEYHGRMQNCITKCIEIEEEIDELCN